MLPQKPLIRLFLFILLLASAGTLQAQSTQKYVLGRLLDQDTKKGVNRAVVLNKRTGQKARTNEAGRFVVLALPGDSLIATSQTHARSGIRWNGVQEEQVMYSKRELSDEKVVQLNEVTVIGKHEEELRRELQRALAEPELREKLTGDQVLSLAQSPVTLLYEAFSKKAKADRKAAVLWQKYRWKQLAEYRFRLVAGNATDLSGDKLDQFMDYCKLEDDFILSASDYDLTYTILQKHKKFQNALGMH
ncbi:hypothetical protein [Tellurirhabdus rosea]|uniref:hypothetical protein n=1 Tax=Tellurirhabdus rosea TaxID=2674997 RepID=UPI00225A8860|nr:hypothetical protein [Tellurirhabdus rosea]